MSGKDFFWKKRNFLNCLDFFFKSDGEIDDNYSIEIKRSSQLRNTTETSSC